MGSQTSFINTNRNSDLDKIIALLKNIILEQQMMMCVGVVQG